MLNYFIIPMLSWPQEVELTSWKYPFLVPLSMSEALLSVPKVDNISSTIFASFSLLSIDFYDKYNEDAIVQLPFSVKHLFYYFAPDAATMRTGDGKINIDLCSGQTIYGYSTSHETLFTIRYSNGQVICHPNYLHQGPVWLLAIPT